MSGHYPHVPRTMEFAPIGIWKLSCDLKVIEANKAAGLQLGLPREHLIGRNILDVIPSLPEAVLKDVLSTGKAANQKHIRINLPNTKQSLPVYWEISVGPVRSDDEKMEEVSGLVLSTVEMTEQEKLIHQKEDIIAALAHNLKAPLVGADRTFESLVRGDLGSLNQQQAGVLGLLRKNNLHVLTMLQDLIEIHRYETNSANLYFEPASAYQLTADVCEQLHNESFSKGIDVRNEVDSTLPWICADKAAIRRLLLNLIANAIKFTEPGGHCRITASVKDNDLLLQVEDTGIGFELEDPQMLFYRFWQGDGKVYSATLGVHLYLSRQIATAHGGTISVKSQPNVGTVFSVTIPLAA